MATLIAGDGTDDIVPESGQDISIVVAEDTATVVFTDTSTNTITVTNDTDTSTNTGPPPAGRPSDTITFGGAVRRTDDATTVTNDTVATSALDVESEAQVQEAIDIGHGDNVIVTDTTTDRVGNSSDKTVTIPSGKLICAVKCSCPKIREYYPSFEDLLKQRKKENEK